MERSKLLEQLAEVEQQVSRDMELIAHQRKILAELNGGGVDTGAIDNGDWARTAINLTSPTPREVADRIGQARSAYSRVVMTWSQLGHSCRQT